VHGHERPLHLDDALVAAGLGEGRHLEVRVGGERAAQPPATEGCTPVLSDLFEDFELGVGEWLLGCAGAEYDR
jgi:hypothetical protein